MATLVLSTVGTALGGPAGGAIGSLVGQSFDQQFLGGGLRKGPRLGDLAVQTSTYGTEIPRIYGTMRIAGSVVWATDLKESSTLVGAKGQPQGEVYSYSVSMAVALSSRPLRSVKRIWADGKLLRGAAGDFKVKTKFRFYSGAEDQPLDPIIASLEGIGTTPAYRGLALAVFEDLELGEYGNRIPFLTFEVEADEGEIAAADILADASAGLIVSTAGDTVEGYAAHGDSLGAAVEPLIDAFGIQLFDDRKQLKSQMGGTPTDLTADELGCGAEGGTSRVQRSTAPSELLPSSILLSYYDPQRDYQTGQQRASIGRTGLEARVQAPAVIGAVQARSIAETMLARNWARREKVTVGVPPAHIGMKPGQFVTLQSEPKLWRVQRCTIEDGAVKLALHSAETSSVVPVADHGRAASSADVLVSPTHLAVFDLPLASEGSALVVHIAAASASGGWRGVPLRIEGGGEPIVASSASRQSVMGETLNVLNAGNSGLFDELNSVDVKLVDPSDWLISCDDDALLGGANRIAIGSEILQFGIAEPLRQGSFRLSHLLRGRRGTEWAMQEHIVGEPFVLLQPEGLRSIQLPISLRGIPVSVTPLGLADADAPPVTKVVAGEGLRPISPVHLNVSLDAVSGSLHANWTRRSRAGWDWLDDVDVPIGESAELYRVTLQGSAGVLTKDVTTTSILIASSELASLGVGPATVAVSQIGDLAASRPILGSFHIS